MIELITENFRIKRFMIYTKYCFISFVNYLRKLFKEPAYTFVKLNKMRNDYSITNLYIYAYDAECI